MTKEEAFRTMQNPFSACDKTINYCTAKSFNIFNKGVNFANEWFSLENVTPPKYTYILCKDLFKDITIHKIIDLEEFKKHCQTNGLRYWKFVERN